MAIGNFTNVTLDNITSIANSTTISEWFIKANHIMYDGWFFFIMMWVAWFVIVVALQYKEDQPLTNAMYSSIFLGLVGLMFRAVYLANGWGLLSDFQLYVFPLLGAIAAFILFATRQA